MRQLVVLVGVVLELQEQKGVTWVRWWRTFHWSISLPYGCGCENCHIL